MTGVLGSEGYRSLGCIPSRSGRNVKDEILGVPSPWPSWVRQGTEQVGHVHLWAKRLQATAAGGEDEDTQSESVTFLPA